MPRGVVRVEVHSFGGVASRRYERRRPQQTVLYRIVAEHNTAAHLVDRVVPDVPVRQWVLSVPEEKLTLVEASPDVSPSAKVDGLSILRSSNARPKFEKDPCLQAFARQFAESRFRLYITFK